MAFLAPYAVSQIPWGKLIVAGVIAALSIACWVMWERMQTAREAQAVAEKAALISAEDAERWKAAAEERGQIIERQNAAIEAHRADLAKAILTINAAAAAAREAEQAADAEIQKWKARARANPDQVVPLGSISRDAVRVLIEP